MKKTNQKILFSGDLVEKRTEDKLSKATRDCGRAAIELIHGLMSQVAKDRLFNRIKANKQPAEIAKTDQNLM